MPVHIYEIHFLFPPEFRDIQFPLPKLTLPEIPLVGDKISFKEIALPNGRKHEFIVSDRYFHIRDGVISIATLALIQGNQDGVSIDRME